MKGVDLALNRDPVTGGSMAAVGLALAGAVLGRCAAPGDVAWSGGAPPSRPDSSLAFSFRALCTCGGRGGGGGACEVASATPCRTSHGGTRTTGAAGGQGVGHDKPLPGPTVHRLSARGQNTDRLVYGTGGIPHFRQHRHTADV